MIIAGPSTTETPSSNYVADQGNAFSTKWKGKERHIADSPQVSNSKVDSFILYCMHTTLHRLDRYHCQALRILLRSLFNGVTSILTETVDLHLGHLAQQQDLAAMPTRRLDLHTPDLSLAIDRLQVTGIQMRTRGLLSGRPNGNHLNNESMIGDFRQAERPHLKNQILGYEYRSQ